VRDAGRGILRREAHRKLTFALVPVTIVGASGQSEALAPDCELTHEHTLGFGFARPSDTWGFKSLGTLAPGFGGSWRRTDCPGQRCPPGAATGAKFETHALTDADDTINDAGRGRTDPRLQVRLAPALLATGREDPMTGQAMHDE
jgi:hypothetical protein